MDVALEDGDGLDETPGFSQEELIRAKLIFRQGSNKELANLSVAILRQIAKDEGERYPKRKRKLLQILFDRVCSPLEFTFVPFKMRNSDRYLAGLTKMANWYIRRP